MGMSDDEGEIPDHYFCEQCRPEEHVETIQALERGEKIWETRAKIYANEKKAGARKKGKGAERRGWLKKEISTEELDDTETSSGVKRKRGEEVATPVKAEEIKEESEQKKRGPRQDKRRKGTSDGNVVGSAQADDMVDDISKLPADRQRIATALSKIIADDLNARAKSGNFRIPDGETAKSLGDIHAIRIEHALNAAHGGTANSAYTAQFRTLNANLKKNQMLITRLLNDGSSADELATMSSSDMASEELQKERAVMKEQLDRQAVAVQPEENRPRFRRTHKGDELIEDENVMVAEGAAVQRSQPVRERTSIGDEAGSPTADGQGSPPQYAGQGRTTSMDQRRTGSQQFDMSDIWAKTAQSPTSANAPGEPRPMQMPPRRRSSIKRTQSQDGPAGGTKEDADIDRMLRDDEEEEAYSPAEYSDPDGIVWRGKLLQSADGVAPTVSARFVAGRDLAPTIAWRDLLPAQLPIDGRLQVDKAEQYLCSLQWSQSSDVSVLAMTPHDDPEGFEAVFQYFKSRQRYAVVIKDRPSMVRDLYIIPVDKGEQVPSHVGMLETNHLGGTATEKCLLASLVVARGQPTESSDAPATVPVHGELGTNGGAQGQAPQHTLPQHLRQSIGGLQGPAGSPMNPNMATFSPPNPLQSPASTAYNSAPPQAGYGMQQPNPLIAQILGPSQDAPTARSVIQADPAIGREKLENLRKIMEDDPRAATDIAILAQALGVPGN